jgi:hypothetical protein
MGDERFENAVVVTSYEAFSPSSEANRKPLTIQGLSFEMR